ncbi:MAG TPA: MFS transporter [Thermoanaerobaculia bacterium]|nr:MFS transporter [Thermoanaerobaculia bacterium]
MSLERTAKARLAVLMGAMLVDMMGLLMVVPLLTFYALRFHASATLIGVMVAAQPFAALVTAPYWGRFSDRFGRRPVILLGLAASGIAYFMFGVAGSLWMLMVSRLIQGIGTGTVGVIQAYVTDTVAPHERTKALGWITVATNVGVAVGPVLGSLLHDHFGERAPGFAAAAMALANVAVAWRLLPEPEVARATTQRRRLHDALRDVVMHPLAPAHRMIWIYSAAMMAFMSVNAVLALFLQARFGVTADNIGYVYAYVGSLNIVMRAGVLGRLVDRIGDIRVLRLGTLALCSGQALLPLVTNIATFAVVVALVPIGTSLLFPATSAQVAKHAPAGHVGEFMGLQQAFGGVARMLGPISAGFIFQHLGVPWPFWLAAVLMGTAGLLAFGATVEPRKTEPGNVGNAGNVEAPPTVVESAVQSR